MYTAKLITHKEKKRIAVYFDHDAVLITRFKKLAGAQWSASLKVWHLPDTATNRKKFNIFDAPNANTLNSAKRREIEVFEKYLNTKRYSANTIKTYTEALHVFFRFYHDKESSLIDNSDVIHFHAHYILAKKLSISYQNQIHPVG